MADVEGGPRPPCPLSSHPVIRLGHLPLTYLPPPAHFQVFIAPLLLAGSTTLVCAAPPAIISSATSATIVTEEMFSASPPRDSPPQSSRPAPPLLPASLQKMLYDPWIMLHKV